MGKPYAGQSIGIRYEFPNHFGQISHKGIEMQMQSLPSNKWHRFGSTTSCHFTIKSLQTEVEYRFKIRARNWHGWGPFGDPSEITVCTPGPPAAPDQPICKFDKESSRIEIVWDLRLLAVKTLVGFDIEMSVMNREEHSWEHVRTWRIPPPVTQQKKTSVEDFVVGEWYRFRVRAETIYGLGSWSEPSMILRTVKEEIDVQDAVWEARTQGVVALYKLLRVYPYNPQVVQKCCSALWNILTTKTKATIYDQPDRPSPTVDELVTVLHAVFDGMDEYEEIVDVQRWGIRAISGILHTFLDNDPFPGTYRVDLPGSTPSIPFRIERFDQTVVGKDQKCTPYVSKEQQCHAMGLRRTHNSRRYFPYVNSVRLVDPSDEYFSSNGKLRLD